MAEKPKRDETPKPALVVIEPFGAYQKGDQIRDAAVIKAVLNSENAGHVRNVVLT